ncbi:hypothetical protein CVT25_015829 [Psilocybe cyanescens]|uniref:Prephenate dehydratase domain-containing protein n=1 Tax=Psilocybe cyanescens TaxID=93625 RepID=A0A409X587_PSICY|nr:hypothetical protein CVT25_015829 [Psilocybe cyanescens]
MPTNPECTFDDGVVAFPVLAKVFLTYILVAEVSTTISEGPKNRYERLENRINELEMLLRQKESGSESPSNTHSTFFPDDKTNALLSGSPSSTVLQPHHTHSLDPELSPISHLSQSPPQHARIAQTSFSHATDSTSYRSDVMWPNWPPSLPDPELLRHLIDVFFVFHPHASRMFHAPSFMHSISLPPNHPKFPSLPVLHAICAIGSLYTAAVTSPPLPNFDEISPDEIFLEKLRLKEPRPDSFAEKHARLAKESAERLNTLGQDLFQVLQANIILTWFYWSHGRWVDIFVASGHSMRLAVPLGLNMCPPFHSIGKSERPPSILPPARTVVEDETRRNTFWLAYAAERQHGLGNGWALSLDNQDVSQLLPVRGDQFLQGTLVQPIDRQWAQSRDVLLTHPDNQTDSFILYIKGTILISLVKAFNLRFRSKHFSGDPSVATVYSEDPTTTDEPVDPRGSAAFIELDHIVSSFRASFPSHLRNPISDNVVDNHLYTACLMPHVLTVVLHDPHAEVRKSGCISALKILTAARAILDLIYNVWSTSFDITLLDSFCTFCWFVGGRVLVRFLQVALDANSVDQISTLRSEIEFIHSAISKVGERIPMAHRFAKMLESLIIKHCGSTPRPQEDCNFPRSLEPHLLHTLFQETCPHPENNINLHESLHDPGSFLSPTRSESRKWRKLTSFDIYPESLTITLECVAKLNWTLQARIQFYTLTMTLSNIDLKVAVLGPLGTYTHEAAFKVFCDKVLYEERDTIAGVFNSLDPQIPLGVIPQENSIFGPVIETYDLLRTSKRNYIRGEITLKIEHCLVVKQGVKLGQIRRIMSHEQALGQCRDFIVQNLPTADTIKMPSTAAAAKALLDNAPDCAAICSSICTTLFEGLEILFTGIQNERSNFTRFFIVAYSQSAELPSITKSNYHLKGLIRISIPIPQAAEPESNRTRGIVEYLKLLDVFTTRIDRRPALDATPFSSVYFIELQGNKTNGTTFDSWARELEQSTSKINRDGGDASLMGVW